MAEPECGRNVSKADIFGYIRDCKRPDQDRLILSVKTDYFVEIHEKITIEELINH